MHIATIGRGTIGGTLARLWQAAGHEVDTFGRDGGDASAADVVLLAVPSSEVEAALAAVTGLEGKIVVDATNRLGGELPPGGHASVAGFVKQVTGGPVAKAFNLNFGKLLDRAAGAASRPNVIWTGDEGARAAVEGLVRDIGYEPVNGGPLEHAATQEAFATMLLAIVSDAGDGLLVYRFATPERL
jgi:8-hydroxy-5-deazaflavin:NADPH oxidoreductase